MVVLAVVVMEWGSEREEAWKVDWRVPSKWGEGFRRFWGSHALSRRAIAQKRLVFSALTSLAAEREKRAGGRPWGTGELAWNRSVAKRVSVESKGMG